MQEYNRCYASVDLSAIEHNIKQIRKKIGNEPALMAIVKADAYGHGAVPVARHVEAGVDAFGVASVEEGLELREAGIRKPVLILGYSSPCQYADVLAHNLTPSVWDLEDARILSHCAEKCNMLAKVHVPVDTGMTRIGLMPDNALERIRAIAALPGIFIEGMFSHLSCADMEEDACSAGQFSAFEDVAAGLSAAGIRIPVKHICNSAGLIRYRENHRNAVRAGIILYGLTPSEEAGFGGLDLRPALEWKTHVIRIEEVPPGHGVSYGSTYVTRGGTTRVATLAVGYADGFPRTLSNRGKVLIRGQEASVIGRVCMDLCMVDITHIPDVHVEDTATLIGKDGDRCITAEELGRDAGSFNYETVCRISKRVCRIYQPLH